MSFLDNLNWGKRAPTFIASVYAIVGSAWIILSDIALSLYLGEVPEDILFFEQFKGLLFVLVTAILLFLLINKHYKVIEENQRDLDLLFKQGNIGLIKTDENGHIQFMSKGILASLGYDLNELSGKWIGDITAAEDREKDASIIKELESGNESTYHYEKRFLHKDNGEPLWFEVNGTVERHHNQIKHYVAFVQNVMPLHENKRRYEEELLEKRALINSTHDIIWSTDADLKLMSFNDAYAALMKRMFGETAKLKDKALVLSSKTNDNEAAWTDCYQTVLRGEHVAIKEHIEMDQKERILEVSFNPIIKSGKPVGASCFARDVTDVMETQINLRAALDEVERTNEFTQLALNRLPIGVAVNNIDTGEVSFYNDEFSNIYGWPMKDISTVDDFFLKVYPDEAYRDKIQSEIEADLRSQDLKRLVWKAVKITTREGEERFVDAKNIPVYDQNLMISTVIDVTDRIHHIETIEDQNERLKAIAWEQSHQIRAPLVNIMGLTSLIQQDLDAGKFNKDLIKKLDLAALQFDQKIRKITELSRQV